VGGRGKNHINGRRGKTNGGADGRGLVKAEKRKGKIGLKGTQRVSEKSIQNRKTRGLNPEKVLQKAPHQKQAVTNSKTGGGKM